MQSASEVLRPASEVLQTGEMLQTLVQREAEACFSLGDASACFTPTELLQTPQNRFTLASNL